MRFRQSFPGQARCRMGTSFGLLLEDYAETCSLHRSGRWWGMRYGAEAGGLRTAGDSRRDAKGLSRPKGVVFVPIFACAKIVGVLRTRRRKFSLPGRRLLASVAADRAPRTLAAVFRRCDEKRQLVDLRNGRPGRIPRTRPHATAQSRHMRIGGRLGGWMRNDRYRQEYASRQDSGT